MRLRLILHRRKTLLTLVVVISFALQTNAEEMSSLDELLSMDLSEILQVEVATGTVKKVSEAPAIVSVITSEDISAMGARTLAEAVERVPGLHVGASSNRLAPLFNIRGIQTVNTPQILVLIDGVEITEITQAPMPFAFRLPVNYIDRIEIIRGPGSAVYGADAVSGVINVITKSPKDSDSAEFGVNLGSYDYVESWVNASTVINDINIGLSITHEKQNNDDDLVTQFGVLDQRRELLNLHLDFVYGDFSFKNWYWKTTKQMGVGAGLSGNDVDRDKTKVWKSQLEWKKELKEETEFRLLASHHVSDFNGFFQLLPPGVWPVGGDGNLFVPPFTPVSFPNGVIGNPRGSNTRTTINATVIHNGVDDHRIRFGAGGTDARLDDVGEIKNFGPGILDVANIPANGISDTLIDITGTPFVYTPDYDRNSWFVSVQDEWQFAEGWELTTGIRYDHYSDFGSTTNPRIALVWSTTEALTSKLLFGTAFRAPRVAELVFVNNPVSLGNPDVQPEEIRTLELAFDYRPNDHFSGKLNLFSYQSEQLIELDQTFTFSNIGEQDGHGVEVEANWQATEQLAINANVSWLNAELPLSGEDKSQVPGLVSFVEMRYRFSPDWVFTTQNYWVTDRKREAIDLRPNADDYLKTDINLLWQPSSQWNLRFTVKNLFDDDIVEPSPSSPLFGLGLGFPGDFPIESRSFYASATYVF